jgi:O-6-methylguanine DNA methyltransferase
MDGSGVETPFAEVVYAVVAGIPRGQTRTYGEVAAAAGRPGAARVVGTIMSRNRHPHVPCHRVIRSDGTIGGYAFGGPSKKRELLEREGAL